MSLVMLTTVDNPYDPRDQYDDWLAFDQQKGYFTNEYLARIANTSYDISDADNAVEIENAIDEIIRESPIPIYRKMVYEDE